MGGVGSGPRSKAALACPRHPRSRVKFDGTYGPPRHRRQRYRCLPTDGGRSHVFTDELPREETWGQACDICERPVQLHYALKNRERTNRLLMLMQLHANGYDSETAYAQAIRDWLTAYAGRPRTPRRDITDPLGSPSLR